MQEPAVTKTVSNAEINRELQILKRCFSLAVQAGKLHSRPHIAMLRESAPRSGFFERAQFEAVQGHLPEALRGLVVFAYITGWRVPSEVQTLEWRQVDFEAGTVRLDPGQTKNGDGRLFPMTGELRAVLEAQRAYTDAVQKKTDALVPYVFHRNGKAVTAFTKAWKAATIAAGCPGRIPHDFRRTAVRNLVRSGVPERVSMQMTGHRTPSVFARYNIVNEADLFDAARRYENGNRDSSVTVATVTSLAAHKGERYCLGNLEAPPGFEPGMEVLQTSALPLGDGADRDRCTLSGDYIFTGDLRSCPDRTSRADGRRRMAVTRGRRRGRRLPSPGDAAELERETGFEPATSTLARSHSTTELFPLTDAVRRLGATHISAHRERQSYHTPRNGIKKTAHASNAFR